MKYAGQKKAPKPRSSQRLLLSGVKDRHAVLRHSLGCSQPKWLLRASSQAAPCLTDFALLSNSLSSCASPARKERAETHLPCGRFRQSARFCPSMPPMLGAWQRGLNPEPQLSFYMLPSGWLPKGSRSAGGDLLWYGRVKCSESRRSNFKEGPP